MRKDKRLRFNEIRYEEKNTDDIINETYFTKEEDKILCKDIIEHLENMANKGIREDKCVSIPFIGSIRKNIKVKTIRSNLKNIKVAKTCLNEVDFKFYVKDVIEDKLNDIKIQDKNKYIVNIIKNKNKSKYNKYYKTFGPAYANMFIASLFMMTPIKYDEEFEEVFKKLNNE